VRITVWGRGKYGKPPGWKQVHKQVIKDLGRIPGWGRGINLKTSTCKHRNTHLFPAGKGNIRENSRLHK
jgi:hypothetical protein